MNTALERNRTVLFVVAALLVAAIAAGGPTAAMAGGKVIELRAGTNNPKPDQTALMMDMLLDKVKQKTNGEVVITNVYNSMGVEQVQFDAIKAGSLDMGVISNGNAGRFTDAYLVWDLPFGFKTPLKMIESLEGPYGKAAFDRFEKDTGVRVLTVITEGTGRDIQTRNKQVKVPADLKGLKIRAVSSPIDLSIWKAWSANPTPVDWGQTYPALQQGVVDGLGIVVTAVLQNKIYEVCKYNMEIDYQFVFLNFVMNSKKLASLKPEHQKAITEAADEVHAWNKANTPKGVDGMRAELKKLGMVFYRPTDAEYKEWTSVRDTVWETAAAANKGRLDIELAKKISASVQ